jgi:hypothetical protein
MLFEASFIRKILNKKIKIKNFLLSYFSLKNIFYLAWLYCCNSQQRQAFRKRKKIFFKHKRKKKKRIVAQ